MTRPLPPALLGKRTQAERVIAKFGGARALAKVLGLDPSTIYKWTYPRGDRQGTGGLIPTSAWPRIRAAARLEGIFITQDDYFPGEL